MEVIFKSKFNPGDVAYGCCEYGLFKFRVDNVSFYFDSQRDNLKIEYRCTAIAPEDCEITFQETFEEPNLMTRQDLIKVWENLLKEDESYEN